MTPSKEVVYLTDTDGGDKPDDSSKSQPKDEEEELEVIFDLHKGFLSSLSELWAAPGGPFVCQMIHIDG